MCGIAGYVIRNGMLAEPERVLQEMVARLHLRGPDSKGVLFDQQRAVGLAHARLSIIDVSDAGAQPMTSHCGRYQLVFNGEIYNFPDIKKELDDNAEQINWRGHSDTEVLLAGFTHWGIAETLKKSNGMFAIAVVDREQNELVLARDRLGEKPLYYGIVDGNLLFASELKALTCFPGWRGEINRDAIALQLRHNYIPTPYSIYQNISKLTPGHFITFKLDDLSNQTSVFWALNEVVEEANAHRLNLSPEQAIVALEEVLATAVKRQMISDVPLGAFLSGGIDSSTIVALMQAQSSRPVSTFTIGFEDKDYNEADHAREVAKHLGTDHHELIVTPQDALNLVPRLAHIYDEPFSDSSQIPTMLVCQMARGNVTVALSGDGGDELFCGYTRYVWAEQLGRLGRLLPAFAWKSIHRALTMLPVKTLDSIIGQILKMLPGLPHTLPLDKLEKASNVLAASSQDDIYRQLVSHWKHPTNIVQRSHEPQTVLTREYSALKNLSFAETMMFRDILSYMLDDILVKVDRASMAVSLESRIPMLDKEVVDFAWRLPLSIKRNNGTPKWILKHVLYRHVPEKLVNRPKVGFAVPLDQWLRGPLREWADDLLDVQGLDDEGFFNSQPIQKMWHEHRSGKRNWQYYLWDILMFQAWLRAEK